MPQNDTLGRRSIRHIGTTLADCPSSPDEGGRRSGQPAEIISSGLSYNSNDPVMKAYVYVTLKTTVLDPQGKTIQGALKKMNYKGVDDVRQGKYFVLTLEPSLEKSKAKAEVERIAREVLTNPVIEEFSYKLED